MSRPRATTPTYSLSRRGGYWYVGWWEDGAAKRISCRTAIEAEARQFLADFRAGRAAPAIPEAPTIGTILTGYEADRPGRSPTLSYCCAALRRHLGDLNAALLTKREIRAYTAARRLEGAGGASARHRRAPRPLSDGTLIRELGALRAALAWAVHEKWIAAAPHIERPSAPPARDRWLTRAEAFALLDATVAHHARVFVMVALHTAARTGAILELAWDRVDLAARTIDFGDDHGLKRRARHIPINDALLPVLTEAHARRTSPWVIEHGGQPVASVKSAIRAAARRAGLTGVTPHVFRHTAVTWMMQAGVPVPMVASYAKMSVQMVEKVYGHHSPEWMAQAARALAG
jgi:integrase